LALAKAAVVVAVAAWAIRAELPGLDRLARLEAPALARAAGASLRGVVAALALATVALGAVDFALQYQRVEAQLRLTPEERREELRAVDGDPALRARRRELARAWRRDPAEALAGAALVLAGPSGLTVVLAGGPPPGRVSVRSVARGPAGSALRRAAERAGLSPVEAPALARRFALGPAAGTALPPHLAAELAELWATAGPSSDRPRAA
jgi:flagellar biosynthesis protein FlhB